MHSLEDRVERLEGRRTAPDLGETILAISTRRSAWLDLDDRTAEGLVR